MIVLKISTLQRFVRKPSKCDWMAKVVFLKKPLLIFGGRCNRYFWDIRLKILRLPNHDFNMLFQLVLAKFFKSELFSCLLKIDHVIKSCKEPIHFLFSFKFKFGNPKYWITKALIYTVKKIDPEGFWNLVNTGPNKFLNGQNTCTAPPFVYKSPAEPCKILNGKQYWNNYVTKFADGSVLTACQHR